MIMQIKKRFFMSSPTAQTHGFFYIDDFQLDRYLNKKYLS